MLLGVINRCSCTHFSYENYLSPLYSDRIHAKTNHFTDKYLLGDQSTFFLQDNRIKTKFNNLLKGK